VGQLLLTHSPGNFSRVAFDSSNDSVRERLFLGTLIQLLDNDNLFTGLTALENDGNLNLFIRSKYRSVIAAAYLARLVY
jgi:hypothetical protein